MPTARTTPRSTARATPPGPRPRRVAAGTGLGPKAQQAEATRDHLIDTTIGLLHERSYHGATVFEVAKAAGVTPGALQHHFGSKAVLMMQVTDAIVRASGSEGVAWPSPGLPLAERCRALVLALWRRAYEPPRFLAAWAVYFGSAAEPELRTHVAQQRRSLAAELRRRFLQVLPELQADADAAATVDLVLSALRGLAMARLFGPQPAAEQAQLAVLSTLLQSRCTPAAEPRSTRTRKPSR